MSALEQIINNSDSYSQAFDMFVDKFNNEPWDRLDELMFTAITNAHILGTANG